MQLRLHINVTPVSELKRLFSNVKRIGALMNLFIGFVVLVRNWYLPLLIRLSPFTSTNTEALITTRNGLKYVLRPKMGDLSILNEILRNDLYSQWPVYGLSLIHISEPTRLGMISYA